MFDENSVFQAARAFLETVEELARIAPGGAIQRGAGGAVLAFTGSRIPALNVVMSADLHPEPKEIALFSTAAEIRADGLPWTIRLRGEPGAEISRIAADHGLTARTRQPFMLRPLTVADRPFTESRRPRIRQLSGSEYETFAAVLGAVAGAPPSVVSSLYTADVLDQPSITAYVAEADDGAPVATVLTVVTAGHLALANVCTLPEYRRRGLARALTGTALRDGQAAGAHTAFLHSTEEALPLFEQAGFRTAEFWTLFSAP